MTTFCYLLGVLCLVGASLALLHNNRHHTTTTPRPRTPEEKMHYKMDELEKMLDSVARQLMLQQLYFNERTRNSYNTGVKQIRYTKVGSRPYHSEAHSGPAAASIHDHPDQFGTVGLGELDAVLNGIDFKTRHNDYKLRMPSDHRTLNDEVDIPFPSVPNAVSHLSSVHEQIGEMREWFRAWGNQNETHRPYKPYFKPVLCYLEGAMMKDVDKLVEPAQVGKHHLDALSQDDMEQKIRFSAYTGLQSSNEDFAFLPRYIMNVVDGKLDLARWSYRIACHPLGEDLPLQHLHLVDDLSARIANNQTLWQYQYSPAARFNLHTQKTNIAYEYSLLDKVMQKVPGKENYGGFLEDDFLGEKIFEIKYASNYTLLNTAYYHRWYKMTSRGAMGVRGLHRGFADSNFFVAQNNQSNIASITLKDCNQNKQTKQMDCNNSTRKYSFAIPLEIIYLTPLHAWNPYKIQYKGDGQADKSNSVTANQRHGGMTQSTAYDGSNSMHWYHLPKEFFNVQYLKKSDPSQKVVGVIDSSGTPREVLASGIRTLLPTIPGIRRVRTRYPIFPVHGQGLGEWKELEALKDMTMNFEKYASLYEHDPITGDVPPATGSKPSIHFTLGMSDGAHGGHTHTFKLTFNQMETIGAGVSVSVKTSTDAGHSHQLIVYFHPATSAFEIKSCDGHPGACSDGHPVQLSIDKQ